MARRPQRGEADTATRILDIAERLRADPRLQRLQLRRHRRRAAASRKASLHYHFAGKAELGEALIARYAARFAGALRAIDARGGDAPAKLERLRQALRRRAARPADVPVRHARGRVRHPAGAHADAVIGFFDENEAWLAQRARAGSARRGRCALGGSAQRGGADDRQRPRGRDAGRAPVRRRGPLRSRGDPAAEEPRQRSPQRERRVSRLTPPPGGLVPAHPSVRAVRGACSEP